MCRTRLYRRFTLLGLLVVASCLAEDTLYAQVQDPAVLIRGEIPEPFTRISQFKIPAGNAIKTLNVFGDQADLQLLFDFELFRTTATPAVEGAMRAIDAMQALLAGKSYEVEFFNAVTMAISSRKLMKISQPSKMTLRTGPPEALSAVGKAHKRRSAVVVSEVTVRGRRRKADQFSQRSGIVSFNREDIERSSAATLEQFLLHTVPQNFGGGATEDTRFIGREAGRNPTRGTALNLRGLGASGTRVLVNGQRWAASGADAFFFDLASLPIAFVERIEIFADAVPLRYGSDVMGGAVNITLRNNVSGLETALSSASATGSVLRHRHVSQLWGMSSDSTNLTLAADVSRRSSLPTSKRDLATSTRNSRDRDADTDLLFARDRISLMSNFSHVSASGNELTSNIVFTRQDLKGRPGSIPATLEVQPSNAIRFDLSGKGDPLTAFYDVPPDLGFGASDTTVACTNLALGIRRSVPFNWELELSGAYGQEQARRLDAQSIDPQARAFDLIRASAWYDSASKLASFDLTAAGPIRLRTPHPAHALLGITRRRQSLRTDTALLGNEHQFYDLGRAVTAFYGEVSLPFFAARDAPEGQALELQIGARQELISGVISHLLPRAGFRFAVSPVLILDATWSRAYRPPHLADLVERFNVARLSLLEDVRGKALVPSILLSGNDPQLRGESSSTWTAGGKLRIGGYGESTLNVTYFESVIRDRLEAPGFAINMLSNPAFSQAIIRHPTVEQLSVVCSGTRFLGKYEGCASASAIVDLRLSNLARVQTRGVDVAAQWENTSRLGDWGIELNATALAEFSLQENAKSRAVDVKDMQNHPLALQLRSMFRWKRGPLETALAVKHAGAYRDTASNPQRAVAAWTTLDAYVAYDMPVVRLAVHVENVANTRPPFLNNSASGYDEENADQYQRQVRLGATLRW